jgi:hypothetical protein
MLVTVPVVDAALVSSLATGHTAASLTDMRDKSTSARTAVRF